MIMTDQIRKYIYEKTRSEIVVHFYANGCKYALKKQGLNFPPLSNPTTQTGKNHEITFLRKNKLKTHTLGVRERQQGGTHVNIQQGKIYEAHASARSLCKTQFCMFADSRDAAVKEKTTVLKRTLQRKTCAKFLAFLFPKLLKLFYKLFSQTKILTSILRSFANKKLNTMIKKWLLCNGRSIPHLQLGILPSETRRTFNLQFQTGTKLFIKFCDI